MKKIIRNKKVLFLILTLLVVVGGVSAICLNQRNDEKDGSNMNVEEVAPDTPDETEDKASVTNQWGDDTTKNDSQVQTENETDKKDDKKKDNKTPTNEKDNEVTTDKKDEEKEETDNSSSKGDYLEEESDNSKIIWSEPF